MEIGSYFILLLIILLFSTFIRSTFGFGDGLLAMPLLTLLFGLKTATPLVALVALVIAFTIVARHWRDIQFASAWRLIVSTLIGIPIGLFFLKGNFEKPMRIILALILILFSLFQLYKPRLMAFKNERLSFLFGFIAGILGGAYNTNGPPVVIYGTLRHWPPETFRATLQGYFISTNVLIVAGHGISGLWTSQVLIYFLFTLPVVFGAIWLGGYVHHRIPKGKFEIGIHLLLLFIGLFLLVESIV
jgi:uncharacterized membrane protein YfcA